MLPPMATLFNRHHRPRLRFEFQITLTASDYCRDGLGHSGIWSLKSFYAIKPVEKGALLFRIGFQQPLGHTALTEDNTLADKPTPVLLDQLSPFTPVLGNLGH